MIIYYYDLDRVIADENESAAFIDKALPYLDNERKDKIARVKPLKDKVRSAAAGLLIRKSFAEFLERTRGSAALPGISYEYGENGKPYIKGYQEFCFSLSHSGNYVVLATSDFPVGIDVQEKDLRTDVMSLSRHTASEEELCALNNETDPGKRQDLFFRMWSAKEAYVKMTGEGLAHDVREYTCNFEKMEIIGKNGDFEAFIKEPISFDGYSLTVCETERNNEVSVKEIFI